MTSTINSRTALTADTVERDTFERNTIQRPTTPVEQPDKGNKMGPGRRMIVIGVAAALAAVGVGAILQNDDPTVTEPVAPAALVTPFAASQGPNVDLPANWLDQPTAPPSTVAGPNADLPQHLAQIAADAQRAESGRNEGPNVDIPGDLVMR